MFCYKCGARGADGARFCHKCGATLHLAEAPSESLASADISRDPAPNKPVKPTAYLDCAQVYNTLKKEKWHFSGFQGMHLTPNGKLKIEGTYLVATVKVKNGQVFFRLSENMSGMLAGSVIYSFVTANKQSNERKEIIEYMTRALGSKPLSTAQSTVLRVVGIVTVGFSIVPMIFMIAFQDGDPLILTPTIALFLIGLAVIVISIIMERHENKR